MLSRIREIHTGSSLRFSFRSRFYDGILLHFVTMPVGRESQEPQESVVEKAARMTCKIERLASKGNMIVLRLCGWIQVEHVKTIRELLEQETASSP